MILTRRMLTSFSYIAAAPPPPVKRELIQSTIKTAIYKPATPSPITKLVEALSSNSPVNDTLSQVVDKGLGIRDVLGTTPSLSLSSSVKQLETSANTAIMSVHPRTLLKRMQKKARIQGFSEWWSRPRRDREAYKALPNKDQDIMIVEGMLNICF